MSLIQLNGINKTYDNGQPLHVLKGIDLNIGEGEYVSIMGASGSGKSTLLNILGILDNYDSGEYWLDGKLIKNLSETQAAHFRNHMLGFFFQSFNLIPFKTAVENVELPLFYQGVSRKARHERAMELLSKLGLDSWAEHHPNELSGGQKQRVAIARALVNNPEVLLLDEPLGALDLQLRRAMQIELKHLQKKLGITFIYITHDQEEAINMSDRIAVMKDGRIEQIGTPDEIYNHPKTSYVATFVGNANILHGVAESIQGENAIVKIGNDRVIVKLETSQQNTEDTGGKQYLSAGEKVTLAVRSENILLQETVVIGDTGTDYRDAVDISVADGSLDAHNKNSVSGLQATVTEKNFAGGQLRVTLKLRDGTQLIASRYGIDASVAEGQTVRCSFLPTDAVLVDREDIHEEA